VRRWQTDSVVAGRTTGAGGYATPALFERPGDDTVQDQVTSDTDKPFGGRGEDLVDGADGDNCDAVTCGPGNDFFDADPGDEIDLSSCERPF
jgi:hypothetical protein